MTDCKSITPLLKPIPEEAFKNSMTLPRSQEYQLLLDQLVDLSTEQKKSFNLRFYAGTLPIAIVGGFLTHLAFTMASMAITGEAPQPLITSAAASSGHILFLVAGSVVTGAYKRFKVLRRIRRPVLIVKKFTQTRTYAPVPPEVRQALSDLTAIANELISERPTKTPAPPSPRAYGW